MLYVSGFIHYDGIGYEPQTISCDASLKKDLIKISELLAGGFTDSLEAYSVFYKVLQKLLPQMVQSDYAFDKTLQTAVAYITNHWNKDFSIRDVAKECCVSESTLYHLFQKEFGQTPVNFLNSIRINMAIEYLENEKYSIATISQLAGFHSENHFRKVFADFTGTTPLKYRKNFCVLP